MPFRGYDGLKDTVANFLARDDLEAEIEDFIWIAETDIQRNIHFRFRDTSVTGKTVENQPYIDLPRDYAEGGFLSWTDNQALPAIEITSMSVTQRKLQHPFSNRRSAGDPSVGTVYGSKLYLGGLPGESDYEFFYKAGVDHLGGENQTNRILEEFPDCLLYGALLVSAPFLGADERIATWQVFYDNAKEETRMAEWRSRASSGPLRMRPDVQIR